jgi:hypothetical protein
MNAILKYFSQPAPIDERPWQKIILSVLLVTFILAVFEPFNFKLRTIGQLWMLIGFALVIMLVTSVVYVVFPKIFKRFYHPDRWTVGRSLLNNLWLLLLLASGVVCYDYFIIMKQLPEYFPSGFLVDLFGVLTIGIVPFIITTLMVQNQALKRNLNESKALNQTLSERIISDTKDVDSIILNSSPKDFFSLRAEDLLYMESSGNYVNVHYKKDNKVNQKLLRSTLKQVEGLLQNQTVFIRCHRAFIVNINQIASVQGNAQGCKLILRNAALEVPVSRTYLKDLKAALR